MPADGHRGRPRGRRPGGGRRHQGRRAPRGPRLPRADRGGEHDLLPHHARAEEGAGRARSPSRGRFTAMIGDGVNDVPALKRARLAVAMGSGSQVTKGIADIVLLRDQFSMLPRAVAEGRRIARNIHRLGRLYVTKTVYAAALIVLVAVLGCAFPFLPRQLTVAAFLTIGIPSFVLALAPSEGPLYRGRLLRALAAFAVPAGAGDRRRRRCSATSWSTPSSAARSRPGGRAATTTLIVLGLCFILLLERGPGREHITIQSYMLAMVAGLGALYALVLAVPPVREFFDLTLLGGGQWFLACSRWRPGWCWRASLADPLHPAARGPAAAARTRRPTGPATEPRTDAADPRPPPSGRVVMPSAGTMAARRPRRTKIVATVGPASSSPRACGADRGRGRRLAAQLLARHTRRARRERPADPRRRRGGRPRGRGPRRPPGPEAPARRGRGRRRGPPPGSD